MTDTAPKRYAHALIRHLIIFSLFMPTFRTEYWNAYYQDFFLSAIIAGFFITNVLLCWKLNFKQNTVCALLLTTALILYNFTAFYNYHTYKEHTFWKNYQLNVTLAFLFFIILLVVKEYKSIVSDKVIKWAIRAIIIHNLIGFIFRAQGYSKIQMMNFIYWKVPYDSTNNYFSWMYYDPSEYALLLLLETAFFIVYKDHFKNLWTYVLSQAILLVGLYLTNSNTFLLAATIMFGCQLIHYALNRYKVPQKYVLLSFPAAAILGGVFFYLLFSQVDTFHTKFLIWKGNWEMLLENPLGLMTDFGFLQYNVADVDLPLHQAHNVFLNHMLRYSLPVGIIFTIMFAIIILFSILRSPNYLSIGIWVALLIPMNMNYALQTYNLPFSLFMIYCIFFRKEKEKKAEIKVTELPPKPKLVELDIVDLDQDDME